MQFSDDQRHGATLEFLAEVRGYLASWPAHPMNRQMIERIDAHLSDPVHQLAQQSVSRRSGAAFTPVGLCLMRAGLHGDALTLSLPSKPKAAADAVIVGALTRGLAINLSPDQ